jgi:hypothetical protein
MTTVHYRCWLSHLLLPIAASESPWLVAMGSRHLTKPKAHQAIRIFDQDHIYLLVLNELEEPLHPPTFLIEAGCLLADENVVPTCLV